MSLEHFLIQFAAYPVVELGGLKVELWWWPFVFALIKNLYILMDAVLIIAVVMVFSRYKTFRLRIYESVEEAIESGSLSKEKIQRDWEEAKEFMESDNLSNKRRAVIMAEEMLDNSFKSANIPGDNLEKRLAKFSDAEINFKEDIIWAHKTAERIKNPEEGYGMDEEEIKRAFYIFERTMKELNIL